MIYDYILALGGNLPSHVGPPIKTIDAAIKAIEAALGSPAERAGLYMTSPVPRTDQPDFCNTAIRIASAMAPHMVLDICLSIEGSFGRERRDRWSARTLDIDILSAGTLVLPSREAWDAHRARGDSSAIHPDLMVPHPRLDQRLFVLAPLTDLVPDWVHPCLGQTAADLHTALLTVSDEDIRLIS